MMLITPNFNLADFACHDGTPYPPQWIESRLKPLCAQLEIIRSMFGKKAVTIDSGYRTAPWNKHVGGEPNSFHMQGLAADIKIVGIDAREANHKILQAYRDGQLAIRGLGSYPDFNHVDIRPWDKLAFWQK